MSWSSESYSPPLSLWCSLHSCVHSPHNLRCCINSWFPLFPCPPSPSFHVFQSNSPLISPPCYVFIVSAERRCVVASIVHFLHLQWSVLSPSVEFIYTLGELWDSRGADGDVGTVDCTFWCPRLSESVCLISICAIVCNYSFFVFNGHEL